MEPCGEAALRVVAGGEGDSRSWQLVHDLAAWLQSNPVAGVYGAVPTYDSVLIEFDPVQLTAATLESIVTLALQAPVAQVRAPRKFTVPVVYGGESGPDLSAVADHLGISEREVIDAHTADEVIVRCLGGPAASCMLDGPAFAAPIPRLADPRISVPANAVSVAGRQGVIGPVRASSGWQLIGLSPVEVLDLDSAELVPYRPGDRVQFREIDVEEWDEYRGTYLRDLEEAC